METNLSRRNFCRLAGTLVGGLATLRGSARGEKSARERKALLSPVKGYMYWRESARALLEPLARLMVSGQSTIPIIGQGSEYTGPAADRLESLVRPLVLAAHWLQTTPTADEIEFHTRIAEWFRSALVIGTTRNGPQYFGPDANFHQFHVEIGLLCIGIQIAPAALWDPLAQSEKDQIARWIGTARGSGIVNNNHYFMGVHILEFLQARGYGRRSDQIIIDEFFARLENMHRGGGWFEDGVNQAYDHYNAFAFHFYGLMWSRLHGARNPNRALRWREWARSFTHDYQHFFAATGEHPAFGRSLCYRFNTINVFGLALAENCCDLSPGMLRRLCTRNLDFFLSRPIYQAQGALSLGWTDEFPPLAEKYSGPASPYWAAKGFAPLLLPPDHPFWTSPEEAMPSEQGDHVHIIKPAGLIVRSTSGAVEIINGGSQISSANLRFGPWKWSKIAYRTGVGYTLAFPPEKNWSPDSAITIQLDDGTVFGRHSTIAVELESTHLAYSTQLGGTLRQINVGIEAGVWWKAGWLLQLIHYDPQQPVVPKLGGYALHSTSENIKLLTSRNSLTAWSDDGRGSALVTLHGFPQLDWETRLNDSKPRTHIAGAFHATPIAIAKRSAEPGWLAALTWCGTDQHEAQAWQVRAGRAGHWVLDHPALGKWTIDHWMLPELPIS